MKDSALLPILSILLLLLPAILQYIKVNGGGLTP
jgi:hypothetical protein